jgi:hypothetical protein
MDAKKVKSNELTGKEISGIMFLRMTGTIR